MKHFLRLLTLVCLLGLLVFCASAAEDTLPFEYTVNNGEVTLTKYTGPRSGSVEVPDEIDGMPVTVFGDYLFNGLDDLEYNLPKTLKRLGERAIANTMYSDLTIPDSVTEMGFACCDGITTLICKQYSAADLYARAFGIDVNYNGTLPGYQQVEDEEYTYWVKDEAAMLVHVDSPEEYVLYVPEMVDDCPVTSIGAYVTSAWFDNVYHQDTNRFRAIVVPASVKRVESYAFYLMTNHATVYLSEGVETVGDYALGNPSGPLTVTLPDSLKTIGINETYENKIFKPTVYAAEGSAGHTYAEQIGGEFHSAVLADGTRTGYYANFEYKIENEAATILSCLGFVDPFMPSYIEQYPVTKIVDGAFLSSFTPPFLLLPPTLTELGANCFGTPVEGGVVYLYYPGTPAEKLVKEQPYPYMSIYEALPLPYDDVSVDGWYYGAVSFAYHNKLMNGVAADSFDPNGTMTRAMLVTVLWRLDGGEGSGASPFTDVPENTWYTKAVIWAVQNNIVDGVGNGKFDPDGKITREQIATILCRYAKSLGVDVTASASLDKFTDRNTVSDYAVAPIQWAVQNDIIGGRQENSTLCLAPQDGGTRAEVAAILMRFLTY